MKAKGYIELDVDIEFDYQPEEPQTRDYPGCEADVDITSVTFKGVELRDALSKTQLNELAEFCWDGLSGESA